MNSILIPELIVVLVVVLGLSLIADRSGPRLAGILSGYPTGSAISLFFFGLQNGATFASNSAIFQMVGLIALQFFLFLYYQVSKKWNVWISSVTAIVGYFLCIGGLHLFTFNNITAVLLPILSVFLFRYLFRSIPNVTSQKKVKLTLGMALARTVPAALIILLITYIDKSVGPAWSGLFTAFPKTIFPLLLIVHLTHGKKQAHTVLKNVPLGIISQVVFSITVATTYPLLGIYLGTLLAFGTATLYLLGLEVFKKDQKNRIPKVP
ncbi:hypothetical protein N9L94_03490 [Robiginitalea sp.]|nr:hypothetical protein [Robiginitalea sp.]